MPRPTAFDALERALDERRAAGLWRTRRTLDTPQRPASVVDGRPLLAFASNDYLGLAADPAIVAALQEGAARWGAGAGASHLVCGHQSPHAALEHALADFVRPCDGARAVTLSSGYLANLAILTALAGRGDAIFADRLNHACLNDGALLSRAELVRYPHLDMGRLAAALEASHARRKLIVSDGVFSMDGDVAPIRELVALAQAHDALLVVDDAHAFGVLGGGRGSLAEAGVVTERAIVMGTLGKAAGVAGAFVAAHPLVVETIVQGARPYVYTTAAPAALAHALLASLDAIRTGDARRAHLAALIGRLRDGARSLPLALAPSTTPIQPLIVGEPERAVALSRALEQRGLLVPAIRPPTVPKGTARLRISLSAAHREADVDRLLDGLRDAIAAIA